MKVSMRKGFAVWIEIAVIALISCIVARTQTDPAASRSNGAASKSDPQASAARVLLDGWGRPVVDPLKPGEKPGPAPRHDISGTWEPARGPGDGIQANGPHDMPYDGKPEHDPPYTPLGLQTLKSHKALFGYAAVLESLSNDPRNRCDPLGFPRADFYQVRHTQIMQDEHKVAILYEFEKRWRIIWIDGRELPKEVPSPRYYGYSVGKWADDTTLMVDTIGTVGDEKIWLDETGRPASDAMHVIERFQRVNQNLLELTVTVDDPKMYTRPWVAVNKFPMRLQSAEYDVPEMMCIPSEQEEYYKDYGDAASGVNSTQSK
ncbi:MAG TPA: hypothetical protein VFB23_08015 [Candidatus Acidoferrales bacterium]|jgi:hypothetical protein|nr:hypothetical protein [Candidatus Acidoferrales bacterium]